jgi:hypothetical protein
MKPILTKTIKMNRTEAAYADQLELLKIAGKIIDWRFNAIRFRMADGAYYKPDFMIIKEDCCELHEVKGFWREAAKVRIKVAAELYPWFRWVVVRLVKGKWDIKELNE